MNKNARAVSWTFASLGAFLTFCFMQNYGGVDSLTGLLVFLGTLLPFACLGLAANRAAQKFARVAVCASSIAFAVAGNGLYYLYFGVLRDDFAWLLFIIVPVAELLVAVALLLLAAWSREGESPRLTRSLHSTPR